MTTATATKVQYIVKLALIYSDGEISTHHQVTRCTANSPEVAVAYAYRNAYKASYGFDKSRDLFVVTSVRKAPVRRNRDDD